MVNVLGRNEETTNTVFSPMNFMKCPRGVGRPKKKRFGAPKVTGKRLRFSETGNSSNTEKRKRGRPLGSKNKTRNNEEPPLKRAKPSMRELAEFASSVSLDEAPETCQICQFNFDHPLKRDILITKCEVCENFFHEPCLRKSGCINSSS